MEARVEEARLKLFEVAHLVKGAGAGALEQAACVMQWADYLAGGSGKSDAPSCVDPAIRSFMVSWNDALPDADRDILKPYAVKTVGSAGSKALMERRAWLARDWYIRTFTPTWLELAGLSEHAETLRKLNELCADADLERAHGSLSAAESAAWSAAESAAESAAWSAAESAAWSAAESAARSAAWSAAVSAAWSAARSAARSAAVSAAWSAAGSAAWSAAGSAAWSAAESAAESAAWSAARSAAWSAAESAAWSAAWSAAGSAARSAAESAAEKALDPTVKRLQKSALELLDRMLALKDDAA